MVVEEKDLIITLQANKKITNESVIRDVLIPFSDIQTKTRAKLREILKEKILEETEKMLSSETLNKFLGL